MGILGVFVLVVGILAGWFACAVVIGLAVGRVLGGTRPLRLRRGDFEPAA